MYFYMKTVVGLNFYFTDTKNNLYIQYTFVILGYHHDNLKYQYWVKHFHYHNILTLFWNVLTEAKMWWHGTFFCISCNFCSIHPFICYDWCYDIYFEHGQMSRQFHYISFASHLNQKHTCSSKKWMPFACLTYCSFITVKTQWSMCVCYWICLYDDVVIISSSHIHTDHALSVENVVAWH